MQTTLQKGGIRLWADNPSKIDMLAYEPYAELLLDIALTERVNPLTIGLFGNWGSGKSTILNLIESKINENNDSSIVSVFVNAWMFEGYDDAKTSLMEDVLRTLEENTNIKAKVGEQIKRLRNRVDWFRVGGFALKKGAPYLLSATLGNPLPIFVDKFKSFLSADGASTSEFIEEISKGKEFLKDQSEENVVQNVRLFRKEFEEMMSKSDLKNLIIIIDDLDRCSPERIIETLEAIKLFLAVKKTTFIIAIDEDVIRYAVQLKYPIVDDTPLDISKDYIEKIVQMPIRIPELANIEVQNYLLLLVCEMFLTDNALSELLGGLKSREVFVNRDIISQSEINSILKLKEEETDEILKTGFTKEDFQLHLEIFSNVSDIIASTLKGNPRQAKRFLNSFYIRKKLSEIQQLNLDLRILAKLMVLEYTHIDLFKELYVWQAKNGGYANEVEEIIQLLDNDEKDENELKKFNSSWFKPTIQQWLKVEPVEFYGNDLRPYFYLAKDSITEKGISILNLTSTERTWINKITNDGLQESIRMEVIKEFKNTSELDHNKIINGVIAKYQNNRGTYYKVLLQLYEFFDDYRDEIVEQLKKLRKKELNPAVILAFKSKINELNSKHYEELKRFFTEEEIIDIDLWNKFSME